MNNKDDKRIAECCNCLQAAMYSICKKSEINPLFVLVNGFSIEYGRKKGSFIREILRLNTPLDFMDYYLNACGLAIEDVGYKIKDFEELDFNNSEGILVWVDGYYCPWNDAYGKTHISHFFLAKDYDRSSDSLVCSDPYLDKQEVMMPIAVLQKSQYRIFEIKKVAAKKNIRVESALQLLFSHIKEKEIQSNYSRLTEAIRKAKVRGDLFESDNPKNCAFNIFTKQISDCYKGLAILFEYIQSAEEYRTICDLLIKAKEIWQKINFVLIRLNLKSENELGNCDTLIDILSEAESTEIELLITIRSAIGGSRVAV